MSEPAGLDRCFTFIHSQIKTPEQRRAELAPHYAVTISRATGSGGHRIADKLAAELQTRAPGVRPWTVFDRNLVEKVLEDHNLPTRLAQFMPEDRVSELEDMMQELLGAQPSSWRIVPQASETILKLAELGNVIIVGRGANVITARLEHVLHVRLVGSLERRVVRMMGIEKLSQKAALALVQKEDLGRRRYLQKYFRADIDDPLIYHLVINTDRFSEDQTARLIADAVLRRGTA
jgi:cytidylate kinase